MRRLFPAVVAVAVAAILAAPGAAPAAPCGGKDLRPGAMPLSHYNATVLCLLNSKRAAAGLKPLKRNPTLERVATHHSYSMRLHNYFAHGTPQWGGFLARIRRSGYLKPAKHWLVAENLGIGTTSTGVPLVLIKSWMASPEHSQHILNPRFTEIGIGSVRRGPTVPAATPARVTITADFGWRAG